MRPDPFLVLALDQACFRRKVPYHEATLPYLLINKHDAVMVKKALWVVAVGNSVCIGR
jgi:hypothetical protein